MNVALSRAVCPLRCFLLAVALLGGPSAAHGQRVLGSWVQEDNDQLNLWMPAVRRLDDEFANGTRLSVAMAGAPFWPLPFGRHAAPCGAAATDPRDSERQAPCLTTEAALAQQIYTPLHWRTANLPVPGERPYAGVLSLSVTGRASTERRSEALAVELGVTGPPSLAAQVQGVWHRIIGYDAPLGWAHQMPAAPVFRVGFEETREAWRATLAGIPVVSILPRVAVSAGNLLTGATAGIEGRAGYGTTGPWNAMMPDRGRPIQVYALAAVRADWIWHERVLDGTSSAPDLGVGKLPWVGQYEFGGGARVGPFEVEYRAVTRAREYHTGPRVDPYGVLSLGARRAW